MSKYGVISAPYFPVFGLNTERSYLSVFSPNTGNTRNKSVFGHFMQCNRLKVGSCIKENVSHNGSSQQESKIRNLARKASAVSGTS